MKLIKRAASKFNKSACLGFITHLYGVRIVQGLRRIDLLVFDENVADNWLKFKKERRVYCMAGLSASSKKFQAYTFPNLASSEALDKYKT